MNYLFFCAFFILLDLIKITNCLQDNNLDPSLANVDIDNPLIQLNRDLIQGRENEALTIFKKSKPFSSNNQTISTDLIHRRPPFNLSCYVCSTDDDPSCEQVNLTRNQNLVKKCKPTEPYCGVLRIEYRVTKAENFSLWTLERNCHETCNNICIQLGERTRLKFCNECCDEPLCNIGNNDRIIQTNFRLIVIMLSVYLFLSVS